MIEIKNRWTFEVMHYVDVVTVKDAVEKLVNSGAYLSGADLSGADLRGAYLSDADLRGAYLSDADLSGANLSGADLRNANLSGANLSGANLSGANLSGADLRNANLSGANLSGANLSGADLSGAYLSDAYLSDAYLSRAIKAPIYCKWSHGITDGNLINIGCEKRTIEEWDVFFNSNEKIETERGTSEFKQIQAVYNAYKAYLQTINQ